MKMGIDIDEEIEQFFEPPPNSGRGEGPVHSILFLLRRDLRDLTGPEDIAENHDILKAPILASFGIMAGLELLARVWLGKNDLIQDEIKKAFKEILEIDEKTANLMMQFRNAIGHGYQLSIHSRDGNEYHFAVDDSIHVKRSFFVVSDKNRISYTIQFWELRARFLAAIKKVHEALADPHNDELRMKFYPMIQYLRPYIIKPSAT